MSQFIMQVPEQEKEAFMETAKLADRNASQLVREFMRNYVEEQRFEAYLRAEVERGLADFQAGRTVSAEEADQQVAAFLDSLPDNEARSGQ